MLHLSIFSCSSSISRSSNYTSILKCEFSMDHALRLIAPTLISASNEPFDEFLEKEKAKQISIAKDRARILETFENTKEKARG